MAVMKEIKDRFCDAFPCECPRCQQELGDYVDLGKLDEVLELLAELAVQNNGKEVINNG